jgi:hypothetical protein
LDYLVHVEARGRVLDFRRRRAGGPELADRDVVGDAVQPRLGVPDFRAGFERLPCLKQRLLKRVLRTCSVRREPAAITKQLVAVSTHHCLECRLVALPRQLHQAYVGLGLKKPK